MNRIELFQTALIEAKRALENAPYMFPLNEVILQLESLIEAEKEGTPIDHGNMTIGQVAARDIETFDKDLAELLHKVSYELSNQRNRNC
ncbi:hypothetical protein KIH87_12720 [Paraneptunicella aestuarii]|uniref:hypothetical protein n=1 Tax=Paraneptunicella aestuarii TaxID=2831148 RepID=UPI001E3B1416|nr:hypothetical protein [Paraneptunicella aestuarii]UAA37572.1 hypothetical protein KIH87_12720 [Paraneptunicella aestuarii]